MRSTPHNMEIAIAVQAAIMLKMVIARLINLSHCFVVCNLYLGDLEMRWRFKLFGDIEWNSLVNNTAEIYPTREQEGALRK